MEKSIAEPQKVPQLIEQFKTLQYMLEQSFANFESLNSIGMNGTNLQELDCSNQQLFILPDSLGDFTSLKQLVCSYNILFSLPESLGNIPSLQILMCDHNQLLRLPESM